MRLRDLNLDTKSPKIRRGRGVFTGLDDGAALLALLAALLGLALVLADDRDTGQPVRHLFLLPPPPGGRLRGRRGVVMEPKASGGGGRGGGVSLRECGGHVRAAEGQTKP